MKVGIKMAKKSEETTAKKTKIRIEFRSGSAIIYRKEKLPFLSDKEENSIKWLKENGYKPEEIEIVGNKPLCWDEIFSLSKKDSVAVITDILESTPAEPVTTNS
jgi:hypothetical protein